MEALFAHLGTIAHEVVLVTIHILEAIGYLVITLSAFKAFSLFFKDRSDATMRKCRLNLAEGLVTGLEFKLAGEILRTLLIRSQEEVVVLGSIVALRVVMALMIYWEMKQEKEAHEK